MNIGINEILLRGQSDGTRQREFNTLGALGREVEQRGHRLTIYLASNAPNAVGQEIAVRCRNADILKTAVPSHPAFRRAISSQRYFAKMAIRHGLDCLHTSNVPVPRIGAPLILTINDVRYLSFPESYSTGRLMFLRWAVPRAIRRADLIVSISEFTKQEICEAYGVPPGKIIVAHIPHDPKFRSERAGDAAEEVRARYGLPKDFMLCVGHLEPRKNYRRILEAFALAERQGLNGAGLVIVGVRSLRWKEIIDAVRAQGCRGSVVFTGFVDDHDMPTIYSLAALLVFTSLHEGFGIPALEAMGCGTPVLASNSSALPEVIGDAGLLVDPESVEEIAHGMVRILTDSKYAGELRKKGLGRVRQFSAAKTATALVDAYERFS